LTPYKKETPLRGSLGPSALGPPEGPLRGPFRIRPLGPGACESHEPQFGPGPIKTLDRLIGAIEVFGVFWVFLTFLRSKKSLVEESINI